MPPLKELLTHRRPSVTSFAIHPAGHFFAVGYADGCIAFWAVDDDDEPLLVRTIDEIDVQVVDGTRLEKHLLQQDTQSETRLAPEREPIYKLAWSGFQNSSDPRGGETAVTILGGHLFGADAGVLVFWLPPFNPPEPPASLSPQKAFQSIIKAEMRKSLMPLDKQIYDAAGLPQDFLLIPRSSPHFSGTFDPIALLLLSDAQTMGRTVEAFQFPPRGFITSKPSPSLVQGNAGTEQSQDSFSQELLSTLESVPSDNAPQKLQLPSQLEIGSTGVVLAQLVKLERDAHQRLTASPAVEDDRLILNGGIASVDNAKADEIRRLKVDHASFSALLLRYHRYKVPTSARSSYGTQRPHH
jgi:syntaxin-binding protein 5